MDSDRALGSFSLFTMLAYLVLAGVLAWLKDEISGMCLMCYMVLSMGSGVVDVVAVM